MNNIIELQDKRTWTKELKDSIRKSSFNNIIKQYNIVGYHYTNLINIKDIFENGLNTLCNRSIRKIIENITSRYPDKNDIINKQFEDYLKKQNFDNRKNKIYFCCDNKQINNGFDYIFKYYGGEITYNAFNNDILGKKLLLGLGEPYIIKFIYNFDDLDLWVMDNLKQQMTDKLLKNKNIELDFSKEKGIKSEEILGAYEVESINEYYHIKKYITNKNFKLFA